MLRVRARQAGESTACASWHVKKMAAKERPCTLGLGLGLGLGLALRCPRSWSSVRGLA